jgi:hypothetical protein
MNHQHDVPLLRTTVSIRSPRSVLLLNPYQLCLVLALFVVALVFSVWPETLEHAPISFEQRGIVHHIWHYTLLVSTMGILWGMFAASSRRLQIELAGLCLLTGCVGLNLTAILFDAVDHHGTDVAGFGIGLRAGFLLALAVRAWSIVREPLVDLSSTDGE